MDRISTSTRAADLYGPGKHGFKDGNLATGVIPTDLNAAWFNGVQEELLAVIQAAGLAPSATNLTQLLAALRTTGVFQTAAAGDNSTRAATTAFVQNLASGKQPLDATLTALAAVATAADKLIYATGPDTFATTALSAFMRTLLDDADAATARATLGAQPLDATLTALAAVATAADRLIYATGSDAFATTVFTAFARTLLDDADATAARATLGAAPVVSPGFTGTPTAPTAVTGTNTTQLATTAFVQAAVAALVASSPAALDTLNELAAALGDDPNFATTMTNALASKVSLTGAQAIDGDKTFTGRTSLAETRYVNSFTRSFSQSYNPAGYLTAGEFQPILTITPTGDSRNYLIHGRAVFQSAQYARVIYFSVTLRSNALPDISWNGGYSDVNFGTVLNVRPVLWVKETAPASLQLAFECVSGTVQNISVDLDVLQRSGYDDCVMNTVMESQLTAMPAGHTQYLLTKSADVYARGELGPGVDLNTIIETGMYTQSENADAATGTNYPTPEAGVLTVADTRDGTGLITTQTYHVYNNSAFYTRSRHNATWFPWKKLAFAADAGLRLIAQSEILRSSATGTLTTSIPTSLFGGIAPAFVMFKAVAYGGGGTDLRSYHVSAGNSPSADNFVLASSSDDTDQGGTAVIAIANTFVLPYNVAQQFYVHRDSGPGTTLAIWVIGYQP